MQSATVIRVNRFFSRALILARRYWFDALVTIGICLVTATAIVDQKGPHTGLEGPVWFDVLAGIVMLVPLYFRRRFPFGAPLMTILLLGAASFVDNRYPPELFIPLLAAVFACGLMAMVPQLRQAIAGWLVALAVLGIGIHNDPKGKPGRLLLGRHPHDHRLGGRLRLLRRDAPGAGGKGTRAPGRTRAGRASTARGLRGARAHRTRAARRRRPQRERHDRPGLGRTPAAQARAGTRA